VVPPKIVVKHPYYRMLFDCETYALDNKSVVYTRLQDRTLGRRKKEVAQSFGVHEEWDGFPPAKVFQFFRKFAKACDDNNISEGEAFYILQDFTKEPLKSDVMMVMPTRRASNPGEVTSYLELINWMLRRHVYEASVATLVETRNFAVQRDDGTGCPSPSASAASTPSAGSCTGRAPSRGALWKVSTARRVPLCTSATPPA